MQNINSESELKDSILALENRQAEEERYLKQQFQLTYEALRPVNLIKNSLKDMFGAPEIKGNIVDTSIGLTAGLFSKVIFERGSHNPIKKILGNALMVGVTNLIGKNVGAIKSVGDIVFAMLRRKPPVKVIEISNTDSTVNF